MNPTSSPLLQRSVLICGIVAGLAPSMAGAQRVGTTPIQHVIMIMQENRSFDTYFGTFPGANGFPAGVCVPYQPKNPSAGCVTPFHDPHDVNQGGPHSSPDAVKDLANGIKTDNLNGFVQIQDENYQRACASNPTFCQTLHDGVARHDVMGYHDAGEIPNYWAYAQNFVLQDQLYESVRSWSYPSHLYLASEWSAICTDSTNAATCTTDPIANTQIGNGVHPWANLFQLLDANAVSWKFYQGTGLEPDCNDAQLTCYPQMTTAKVAGQWNVPNYFSSVRSQGSAYLASHNPAVDQLLIDLKQGTLPQVSWVIPTVTLSEHPPQGVTLGMQYVTSVINAVMQSPYWASTAIFLSWDDWGGFYDNVAPPNVDRNPTAQPIQGYGLRVPGLLISAYARKGYIDHNVLSFDTYATFFEDLFMDGARLDPVALGNPDSRPDIRDALTKVQLPDGSIAPIGNLMDEFDFTQTPLPPLVLTTHIPTGIAITCRGSSTDFEEDCTQPTVNITWLPVTGPEVPGPFTYHITRDGTDLPQCVGTATACTDTPPKGAHLYRAYSVDSNAVTSPQSAAAEADMK